MRFLSILLVFFYLSTASADWIVVMREKTPVDHVSEGVRCWNEKDMVCTENSPIRCVVVEGLCCGNHLVWLQHKLRIVLDSEWQ